MNDAEYPPPGLNRIGHDQVTNAVSLIREGRVYDLGTEIGGGMPHGPAEVFGPFRWLNYRTPGGGPMREEGFQFSMELIMGSPHQGSHIDALAHIQTDDRIYGGATVDEALGDFGWRQHGAETIQPIVGRGILLDVAASEGVEQLRDDHTIGVDDLERCLERQGTDLRSGDVVLVRTGKIAEFKRGEETFYMTQPGVGRDAGLWLYERGMAVLGTDTSSAEPSPFADATRTLHRALIVERGVHLLEILDLDELAADRVHDFFFTCAPLKLVGATGSWVRPLAIV